VGQKGRQASRRQRARDERDLPALPPNVAHGGHHGKAAPQQRLSATAQTATAWGRKVSGFMQTFEMLMSQPFFHPTSGTVRFWVLIDDLLIGASIGKETLHYRYTPQLTGEDPLATYTQNAAEIDAAVRRRVAGGSREPVMLRDFDVRATSRA
jgi:hypothetical protein